MTPAVTLTLTLARCVEELDSELGCIYYYVYESDYCERHLQDEDGLQDETIDIAAVSTGGGPTT